MCFLPRLILPPPQVYMAPRPAEADAVLAVRSKLRANANLRQAARQAGVPVYAIKSASSSNLVRAFKTLLGQEPSAGGVGGVLGGAGAEGEGGVAAAVRGSIDLEGSRSSGEDTDGEEGDEISSNSVGTSAGPIPGSSSGGRQGGAVRALQQEEDGLEEARLAAEQIVMPLQQPVELLPRPEFVRKAQAAMCERYGLAWEVVGTGSEARLRVCPKMAPAAAAAAAAAPGDGEKQAV
jgi:hypothetical protein